jgi:protein phosphatase inhibitor 2
MKITEPKTPYAQQYDPLEDEAELARLDAEGLVVDEVEALHLRRANQDIPDMDLGEPEMEAGELDGALDGERRVIVEPRATSEDGEVEGRYGEESVDWTAEERAKHRKFEEMRKKHYEMRNVKEMLA